MISVNSNFDSLFVDSVVPPNGNVFRIPENNQDRCAFHIERLVAQIAHGEIKTLIGSVFQDLLRLLECLSLTEGYLQYVDKAEQTLAFFRLIHDEARALVDFIGEDALANESLHPDLREALDGVAFALTHDLRRVFENDVIKSTPPHARLSEIHRAHHVLRNCLQQSIISLAIVFDSELTVTALFNNSDIRYRQSLELCQALLTLRQLNQLTGETNSVSVLQDLTHALEVFRNESMEYLMYSDWPQFEGFCERIIAAGQNFNSLTPLLHQFECYLETLLAQVRMRAVFIETTPGSVDISEIESPMFQQFAPLTSSLANYSEVTPVNALAFAL